MIVNGSQIIDIDTSMNILRLLYAEPTKLMSWGFDHSRPTPNGVAFEVNGFKHKGWCEVIYDEGSDTYTFRTYDDNGKIKNEIEDCYCDNLVSVIDAEVETNNDQSEEYKERFQEWLNFVFGE
jgi:hypothetical protein